MLSGIRVCSPDAGLSGSLTGNPRKLDYLYLIRINRRNIWVLLRLILSSTHRDLIFPLTAIQSESLWTRQKVVSLSYKYGFTLGQEFRSSFTVCFRPVLCGVKWKVIESADNTCLGLLDGDRICCMKIFRDTEQLTEITLIWNLLQYQSPQMRHHVHLASLISSMHSKEYNNRVTGYIWVT